MSALPNKEKKIRLVSASPFLNYAQSLKTEEIPDVFSTSLSGGGLLIHQNTSDSLLGNFLKEYTSKGEPRYSAHNSIKTIVRTRFQLVRDVDLLDSEKVKQIASELKIFIDPSDLRVVLKFLKENPIILSVLKEAPEEIGKVFLNDFALCLNVFRDPEDSSTKLFLIIKTKKSSMDARNLLEVLDENWWLDRVPDLAGTLNINVESTA
jgi:uncharacterized protein (DUF1697 family)